MTDNFPDPRLLTWTAKQTAAALGVTLSTVKALQASGELRPVDIRGETRYLPDAVRAYVAGLRPQPQRVPVDEPHENYGKPPKPMKRAS